MKHLIRTVAGKKLLYVMAAEPEYGEHLRRRISPLMTGIGPVEAAVQLTACLSSLFAVSNVPDLIVSLGSAGSSKLMQTGIYQVSSVSYRDMDASPLGFEKGRTPLLDLPVKVDLPIRISGMESASLATGASVVTSKSYELIDAEMVDMETFAILRACHHFGLPLIGIRGISDGATDVRQLSDWTQTLPIIDEKLAQAVDLLERSIATNALQL